MTITRALKIALLRADIRIFGLILSFLRGPCWSLHLQIRRIPRPIRFVFDCFAYLYIFVYLFAAAAVGLDWIVRKLLFGD